MAKYTLQHDEAVILKADRVMRGGRPFAVHTDDLVLTNLHLIVVNKGMLGNVKRIDYLPLATLKVFNEQAQVIASKAPNGSAQLEVFFQTGEEEFVFQTGGRREVERWVDAISRAVTGRGVEATGSVASLAIPGTAAVADTLRDTFGQFRAAFGGGKAEKSQPATVSGPCSGCGASLSGTRGTAVTCEHCDSATTLS